MAFTIVGIVGTRNTGKTTSLINLSKLLVEQGFKVAILKFMSHKFDIEDESKDSYRFRSGDSSIIISASPVETVTYQPRPRRNTLKELLPLVPQNTDFILCEGIPVNEMDNHPIIFCCRDEDTYNKLRIRYSNVRPIYITGLISNTDRKSLDNIPVVSAVKKDGLNKIVETLKNIRKKRLGHT